MPKQKRIAVIDRDLCNPKSCGFYLCQRVCPVNRANKDCITVSEEDKKPFIAEELCIGCGICPKKCPNKAIMVVNLPERLDELPVHRYGRNSFSLYRLPLPKKDMVTALIGPNGTGKSTIINIMSGNIIPNSGKFDSEINDSDPWKPIREKFKGTELQDYIKGLSEKTISVSCKPQHVDMIPNMHKGKAIDKLSKMADQNRLNDIVSRLGIKPILDKDISGMSGGELQLFAVAAAMLKESDFYFFDEPSSYLDVSQRMNVAREIRELSKSSMVMVVEHDLAMADYLADNTHILFGKPGVFGIVSSPYGVRVGINTFLSGYLKEENIRFRDEAIIFHKQAKEMTGFKLFAKFGELSKTFGDSFSVKTESGELYSGEIIGILGPNAIGKTTFIRMLIGDDVPDEKAKSGLEGMRLSYKPQRLVMTKAQESLMVTAFIKAASGKKSFTKEDRRVLRLLKLENLFEKPMKHLSGGETQSVFIASALIKDCDIMLFDEPSAFLDVEARLSAARLIRERCALMQMPCFVVDHDLQFIDAISDRIMVFSGTSGKQGLGASPSGMEKGMNTFLMELGMTFRRDPSTGRPRANKPGSQKDAEQKARGQYYYSG